MDNTVIISLGSNINPLKNIARAIELLPPLVRVLKSSSLLVTEPIGISEQPAFHNGALLVVTHLNRSELTSYLKHIEDVVGRDRTRARFGPREIDLDILEWNGEIVDSDYFERDFLVALVDELKKR
jgi:2-amino-4-hydroxy-6-hydroxymethyldihydropteridine diphosphokinase